MAKVIDTNDKTVALDVRSRTSADVPKADAERQKWTLEFDGCTDAQILELASRSVVIRLQNRYRHNPGLSEFADSEHTFDVAREMDLRVTRTVDPLAEMLRQVDAMEEQGLVDEDRAEEMRGAIHTRMDLRKTA